MGDLTLEFLSQIGFNPQFDCEDLLLKYESDYSEFTVVDGEEGDFGIIKHYNDKKILIAKTIVKGGDEEETEFTEEGKILLRFHAFLIFQEALKRTFPQELNHE